MKADTQKFWNLAKTPTGGYSMDLFGVVGGDFFSESFEFFTKSTSSFIVESTELLTQSNVPFLAFFVEFFLRFLASPSSSFLHLLRSGPPLHSQILLFVPQFHASALLSLPFLRHVPLFVHFSHPAAFETSIIIARGCPTASASATTNTFYGFW